MFGDKKLKIPSGSIEDVFNESLVLDDIANQNSNKDIDPSNTLNVTQLAAFQENGALMQVIRTNDFEVICNFTQTPDARENNIFGTRIPVLGMYWVSDTHLLMIS